MPPVEDIDRDVLRSWNRIVTLIAEFCDVPAALVMRGNPASMEVMASADRPGNPYEVGHTAPREGELYCEAVIADQQPLEVPHAQQDPDWKDNPDTRLGLFSYFGLPLNWPSGEPFGTICILDAERKTTTPREQELMRMFADVVETHLAMLERGRELEFLATHDPMLETWNRRAFFGFVRQRIAEFERHGVPVSLLLLDLDHFKMINDSLGHQGGDQVLQEFIGTLQGEIRASDVLGRIGGEEFAVLSVNQDEPGAYRLAERLRNRIAESERLRSLCGRAVTVSIGLTPLRYGDTVDSVFKRADEALYRAKESGRNRTALHEAG